MTSRSDAGRRRRDRRRQPRFARGARPRSASRSAAACSACPAARERGDGFIPITAETRGPADEPAPYREWSGRGRWVAPLGRHRPSCRRASPASTTGALAAPTSAPTAPTAPMRRCGWSDAGSGSGARSAIGNGATSQQHGQRQRRARPRRRRVLLQDSVPSHGLGGSVEVRPPMPRRYRAAARRRCAAHERRNARARQLCRRRSDAAAAGRRRNAGPAALSPKRSASSAASTLSGGARIDHWQISGGHLFEQTIATGAVTRDEHYRQRATDGCRPRAAACSRRSAAGSACARRPISAGGCRRSTNCSGRSAPGPTRPPPIPQLDPERLAGAEAGLEFARGPLRLSLTGFVNRLSDAIANVTLGNGPGTFPQVGFVARRRRVPPASECRCGEGPRGRGVGADGRAGPWAVRAGASLTHARMQASGAAAVARRTAAGADAQLRRHARAELGARRQGRGDRSAPRRRAVRRRPQHATR